MQIKLPPPRNSAHHIDSKHINRTAGSDFTVKLLIANIIAELLVITNHYTRYYDNNWAYLNIDISSLPMSNCLNWLSASYLFAGATSVFFLISGYLFFRNYDSPGAYRGKLKRRLFTLAVPYLLWNLIASKWVLKFFALIIRHDPISAAEIFGTASVFSVFVGQPPMFFPADSPLWFMRELMLMCLFAPAINRMMRCGAAPLILVGLFATWRLLSIFIGGWLDGFTQSLFFFSLGAYICINGINPFSCWKKFLWPSIAFLVIFLTCTKLWEQNLEYWIGFTDLAKVSILMTASDWLSRQRYGTDIAYFGSATFFLYVTHCILIWQTQKFMFHVFNPTTDAAVLFTVIFTEIAALAVLLAIWEILCRLAPRAAYILTGGRSKIRSRYARRGRTAG